MHQNGQVFFPHSLLNTMAPASICVVFGQHAAAGTVNATVGDLISESTACLNPILFHKVPVLRKKEHVLIQVVGVILKSIDVFPTACKVSTLSQLIATEFKAQL